MIENMPSRLAGNSRKARFEQTQLVRQTVVLGVLTVAVIATFILVVMPAVLRFIGSRGSTVISDDSGQVPQIPLVSAPVNATSSATLVLNGFSQKGNIIVLLNNNHEIKRVNVSDDGAFSSEISLNEGENKLAAYAIAENNKQSEVTQEYTVQYVKEPPKLDISEPTDNQSISGRKNQNLTVKGTTKKNAKVYINDRLIFTNADGTFSTLYHLNNGANELTIKAVDEAGNTTEKKLTVNFAE